MGSIARNGEPLCKPSVTSQDQALKKVEGLISFLIGQVMKATSGRANPQIVRTMILERLHKRQQEEGLVPEESDHLR